jgi:hypothetical protein
MMAVPLEKVLQSNSQLRNLGPGITALFGILPPVPPSPSPNTFMQWEEHPALASPPS